MTSIHGSGNRLTIDWPPSGHQKGTPSVQPQRQLNTLINRYSKADQENLLCTPPEQQFAAAELR